MYKYQPLQPTGHPVRPAVLSSYHSHLRALRSLPADGQLTQTSDDCTQVQKLQTETPGAWADYEYLCAKAQVGLDRDDYHGEVSWTDDHGFRTDVWARPLADWDGFYLGCAYVISLPLLHTRV